jgi:hypothetical protein
VPVFTLGFNLILRSPVPFEYWFLVLLPRSSLALFTCGFTSLIIGSGGGAVGAGGAGGGGAGGNGGGGAGDLFPPKHIIKFPRLFVFVLYNLSH